MTNFDVAMTRAMLFELAVLLIVLMLTIWISYLVLKNAIRDGINESKLGDRWRPTPERNPTSKAADLPDMRAER